MKILFTSVGRRVELMQAFKKAAQGLGVELTIIGADISNTAPALFFCDETKIVCRIREPEYIPQLLSICEEEKVDCLIPTIDTDLLILAENKEKFMYRCPFLNDEKVCTVYDYRGLICRTFGLLKPNKDGKINMPFCQSLGLNYSKVYNKEKKMIDENLVKDLGYKNTPKAYQIDLKTLMSKDLFEDVVLDFGEVKSLVDWL